MRLTTPVIAAAILVCAGPAFAAAPAPAKPPGRTLKLVNADSQAISSIYASPPGRNDWGDDLLGKQTAAAGRSVVLSFGDLTPETCTKDLQMLMNDGKVVTKTAMNICETPEYRFTR